MRVRTAVIPAAGLGTRFLPATKAVPKELLPIVDVPALQLIIDEAVGAGIEHIVIVNSHSKPSIEAYFADAPSVIDKLISSGRVEMADRLRSIGVDVQISFAYQDEQRGLGHAVGCASDAVGDEPFAVLLPDELMGSPALLDQMARLCESTGGGVVGLKEVPHEQVGSYGVIDPVGGVDGVVVFEPVSPLVELELEPSLDPPLLDDPVLDESPDDDDALDDELEPLRLSVL